MKAEWRYVLTLHGVLCVMIIGTTQMLLCCVESWDTPLKVTNNHYISTNIFHYNLNQQMQCPSAVLTLVLAEAQSTYTTALVERVD